MGMFSAAKRRSPNATVNYPSSPIRTKKNYTDYLDSLSKEETEKVVNWAVGKERAKQQQSRRRQKDVMIDVKQGVKEEKEKTRKRKTEKRYDISGHNLHAIQIEHLMVKLTA